MMETIPPRSASSSAVSARDSSMKSVTVLPMAEAVRFLSPPVACAMLTVAPIARPTSMTVSMCITCEPMETAVVLATPSNWPMMKRSAMP